jgi:hypothetical protein
MNSENRVYVPHVNSRKLNTGKRDAVRNKSGLPVDHSGPELGVGPTPSINVGRKPGLALPFSSPSIKVGGGPGGGASWGLAKPALGCERSEAAFYLSS